MFSRKLVVSLLLVLPLVVAMAACGPYYGRDSYGYGGRVSAVEVERAIERNPHVTAGNIRVHTEGNRVFLSGFVDSEHQREEAVRAAYTVRGVSRVYADELRIDRYSHRYEPPRH